MKLLSRKEEILLLIIRRQGDEAYGVPIREAVVESTQRHWSIGAVYDVLDRLARKGLVSTWESDPTAERGGKARRFYKLTPAGMEALNEVYALNAALWDGLAPQERE